jgi:predicted DNA-binding transcriptional regulator YafY
METLSFINRLQRIDRLIRLQATGTARQLAEKLEITERSVYNYLNYMKRMGAPVVFSPDCQSYTYADEGYFYIGFIQQLQYFEIPRQQSL